MKNFFLISILLGGLSVPRSFSQKNFDTPDIKDSSRIAAEIFRSNSTKSNETALSKPKTILWAGLTTANWVVLDYEINRNVFLQFGAEIGFKKTPIRLEMIAHPYFLSAESEYANFEKNGLSGEIGLVLKKFTVGRLTGNVSKAYFGMDIRTGRQAYTYSYSSSEPATEVKITWTSVMPCVGFQFTYKMLAFDLSLPIGYQRFHSIRTGNYDNNDRETALALQPSASIGLRF